MSTEFWILYDAATGAELVRGSGPPGAGRKQQVDEGQGLMVVPRAAVMSVPADLDVIRDAMRSKIDAEAEHVRCQFITPGSGQALSYQRKEAEARAWQDEDDPASAPFLAAEAAALGIPITTLAATVIAQADAWVAVGSAIEGARIKAKTDIGAAANLAELAAAGAVDWADVLS